MRPLQRLALPASHVVTLPPATSPTASSPTATSKDVTYLLGRQSDTARRLNLVSTLFHFIFFVAYEWDE
jgi:hypothetical protein